MRLTRGRRPARLRKKGKSWDSSPFITRGSLTVTLKTRTLLSSIKNVDGKQKQAKQNQSQNNFKSQNSLPTLEQQS